MRFEAVVIPDCELEGLADKLLTSEVHEYQRLMPLRFTRVLYVTRPTFVVRAVQTFL